MPNERRKVINSLPNEVRSIFQDIECSIIEMERLEDAGVLTQQQRRNFFALIIGCIPYARIDYPTED